MNFRILTKPKTPLPPAPLGLHAPELRPALPAPGLRSGEMGEQRRRTIGTVYLFSIMAVVHWSIRSCFFLGWFIDSLQRFFFLNL